MTMKRAILIHIILLFCLLTGCTSRVVKSEGPTPEVRALQNVTVEISPHAVVKVAGSVDFDAKMLSWVLEEALNSRELMASNGDFDLKVVISDVRVRSTASAVWLGMLAGDDHLIGDAIILNRNGDEVFTFTVEAVYAWGGITSGGDSTRVYWLYEKFSDTVTDELVAKREKKE